jgi:hypothetical protein
LEMESCSSRQSQGPSVGWNASLLLILAPDV